MRPATMPLTSSVGLATDGHRDWARRALARCEGPVVITVPAPVTAPDVLLCFDGAEQGVLWHPPTGPAFSGVGAAHRLQLDSGGALEDIRGAARELFRELVHVVHPAASPTAPRLFGGLAFAPGAADEEPWVEFGEGSFVLPRFTYGVDGDRAWLSLAVASSDEGDTAALDELEAVLAHLARGRTTMAFPASRTGVTHLSEQAWAEQVEAIRSVIVDGHFDKVVAARRSVVHLDHALDPQRVLARLRARFPGCTRFAVVRGETAFVGATPERLVRRRGRRVETEALAGSMELGRGEELLASTKDRQEHELVVDMIVAALDPLCVELERDGAPTIRELPNVLHMETPIRGELRADTHVLELVAALHPTPAVGGVPTHESVDWIAAHEHAPRGWYSGPVGWFDADGDGSFVVALRSGVLQGRRAWVYAGAGIVQDSEPCAEYAETELKMGALLGAIGGETG